MKTKLLTGLPVGVPEASEHGYAEEYSRVPDMAFPTLGSSWRGIGAVTPVPNDYGAVTPMPDAYVEILLRSQQAHHLQQIAAVEARLTANFNKAVENAVYEATKEHEIDYGYVRAAEQAPSKVSFSPLTDDQIRALKAIPTRFAYYDEDNDE